MSAITGNAAEVISLPSGGGAVRGIGGSFSPDVFTGTGNYSISIPLTEGREGFGPKLTLQYSTGNGNGVFGLGWEVSIPRIIIKTDRGIPKYDGADPLVLVGAGELIPLDQMISTVNLISQPISGQQREAIEEVYTVQQYRLRNEGTFSKIERWQRQNDNVVHWRLTTRENITSIFGITNESRISNPNEPGQVHEWLLQETYDTKGNHTLYEYAQEEPSLPTLQNNIEKNRSFTSQRYIRRIYYGNAPISLSPERRVGPVRRGRHYLFEVLFDYGDLDQDPIGFYSPPLNQTEQTSDEWPIRPDPFSSYRAGFEIRTLRRCCRIGMIHHFRELEADGKPDHATLVSSVELAYGVENHCGLSLLQGVTLHGYRWSEPDREYRSSSLPPIRFGYSQFNPLDQRPNDLAVEDDLFPPGLDNRDVALVDLFGSGLPDILHTTGDGFRYWRNLGGGRSGRPQLLNDGVGLQLSQPGISFADMSGDGRPDLLVIDEMNSRFYDMGLQSIWTQSHEIARPGFDLDDRDARLIDLTGNGLSDLLVTLDPEFIWYESLGAQGYRRKPPILRHYDSEHFPDVKFSSPNVRLADMSGDGLKDIVLLKDGEISYWPNQGYGRFGSRIAMTSSPYLGDGEIPYELKRMFLVDVNGSGCDDLVYIDQDRVHIWFNCSGNNWSTRHSIDRTPRTPESALDNIKIADLFGKGTATLIWGYTSGTSPDGSNYKSLDLCKDVKPYLLNEIDNGLGSVTLVEYATSIKFFLEDEFANSLNADGKQRWITRLPFPVQVVKKIEVLDHTSRTKVTNQYSYHHGYWDGAEREFKGFGRVDRIDSEEFETFNLPGLNGSQHDFQNNNPSFHAPPILTKTWFHTGAFKFNADEELTQRFEQEYWQADEKAFPVAPLEAPLEHDAYRAMKGAVLREEVFALDGSRLESIPFEVKNNTYRVIEVQPAIEGHSAIYLRNLEESFRYIYERNPDDPRVEHQLTLGIDQYGNATDVVLITYPRRITSIELPEQNTLRVLYTKTDYINADASPNCYFIGVSYQERILEISGVIQSIPEKPLEASDFLPIMNNLTHPVDQPSLLHSSGQQSSNSSSTTSVFSWKRNYFRSDAAASVLSADDHLTSRLPLGKIESLGLPWQTYQAVTTDSQIDRVFGLNPTGMPRVTSQMLDEAGYVREDDIAEYWWIPEGIESFDPASFYLVLGVQDPFGNTTRIEFDDYALMPESVFDALGNETRARNDYRVVRPKQLIDPNKNITEILYDTMGIVVGTAARSSDGQGDSIDNVEPDVDPTVLRSLLSEPMWTQVLDEKCTEILSTATTRYLYDPHHYLIRGEPAVMLEIARERHSDETGSSDPSHRLRVTYTDGQGQTIQTKLLAGYSDNGGGILQPRWISTGATLYNNKNMPVREYEPYETNAHRFGIEIHGVSSIAFYDARQRVVGRLFPNRTYEKTIFSSWSKVSWDVNDTVNQAEPKNDEDLGAYFRLLDEPEYSPTWYSRRETGVLGELERQAAEKTLAHANTPASEYMNPQGRVFLSIVEARGENGSVNQLPTRRNLDILGNILSIVDPRGNLVFEYTYDLAGRQIASRSADAGLHLAIYDTSGKAVYAWDSTDTRTHNRFDSLRRPKETSVSIDGSERTSIRTTFGEMVEGSEDLNLRGRIYEIRDQAGLTRYKNYDFKGNILEVERQLTSDYSGHPNWDTALELEDIVYVSKTSYDALNRVTSTVNPDGSRQHVKYNRHGFPVQVFIQLGEHEQLECFVEAMDYNARGQLTRVQYGNKVVTESEYDSTTFRISRVTSRKPGGALLQDMSYIFDPIGNITSIHDHASDSVYFDNNRIDAVTRYTYDPLYRLIEVKGREHEEMTDCHYQYGLKKQTEFFQTRLQPISNNKALLNYAQRFEYDASGNLEKIRHSNSAGRGWTRTQDYSDASNQLLRSQANCRNEDSFFVTHDPNGNISAMPHLSAITWDQEGRMLGTVMSTVTNAIADRSFYSYDVSGQRVRKVIVRGGQRAEERIYLGSYEVYRKYNTAEQVVFERTTIHVVAGAQRIALIENQFTDGVQTDKRIRYQFNNHTGSSLLEVNEHAETILYEEYYAYGGTAYILARSQIEVNHRRYRYSGKERDDETGLYYYGARYYSPWLGRWISPDPAGTIDGLNLYRFVLGNPVRFSDPHGMQSDDVNGASHDNEFEALDLDWHWENINSGPLEPLEVTARPLSGEYTGDKENKAPWQTQLVDKLIGTGAPKKASEKAATLAEQANHRIQDKFDHANKELELKEVAYNRQRRINQNAAVVRAARVHKLETAVRDLASASRRQSFWSTIATSSSKITPKLAGALRATGPGLLNVIGAGLQGFNQFHESKAKGYLFRSIDAGLSAVASFGFGTVAPAVAALDALLGLNGQSKFDALMKMQSSFLAHIESRMLGMTDNAKGARITEWERHRATVLSR